MRRWPIGFALALALAAPIHAQQPQAPDRWRLGIDLAVTAASGNENFMIVSTGAQVSHLETDRFELELTMQARYGESRGEEIARSALASLAFDYLPEATVSPFVFTAVEHDAVRALDTRVQSGAGAKYTFWRDSTGELSLSLAGLYDREDVSGGIVSTNGRWSWRAKGEKTFANGVRIHNTTFYQPVWDIWGDYLASARTGVSTRVGEHVSLTVTHTYEHDATPPTGIVADEHALDVGLKLDF